MSGQNSEYIPPKMDNFLLTDGTEPAVQLDDLDRRILSILSRNARLSARAIARELEVSATLVLDRISRLEASKTILGYRVEVSPAAVGFSVSASIGIRLSNGVDIRDAMSYLATIDEVQVVVAISGQYDLLVSVLTKNIADLSRVTLTKIRAMPGFSSSDCMIGLMQMRRVGGRFSFVWTNE
ncbi:Lrp/AsnC family transcriptional regulator [Pseudochelatococcus sp. B33]